MLSTCGQCTRPFKGIVNYDNFKELDELTFLIQNIFIETKMKKSNNIPPLIPPCHLRMGVNIICIAIDGKLYIYIQLL